VDHARKKKKSKRDEGDVRVTFDENLDVAGDSGEEVLALDEALKKLARLDERDAVELRNFDISAG